MNIAIAEVITQFQSAQYSFITMVHKIREIEQKQAYTHSLPVNPKIVYAEILLKDTPEFCIKFQQ